MLKTYILKVEYPVKLFDFLAEFISSERRSALLCRKNRKSAEASIIGELLAKYAIKKHFGIPFSKQHFLKTEHGKPYLEGHRDIHFNISHSGEYVVCAVSDRPVGIDIEKTGAYRQRVAKRICSREELDMLEKSEKPDDDFSCLWTQKEAVLKRKGTGLSDADIKSCLLNTNVYTQKFEDYYISTAV